MDFTSSSSASLGDEAKEALAKTAGAPAMSYAAAAATVPPSPPKDESSSAGGGGGGSAATASTSLTQLPSLPLPLPFESNKASKLWNTEKYGGPFYRDTIELTCTQQIRKACVSTCLGILTNTDPAQFQHPDGPRAVNTQDPVEWSEALKGLGMQLAFLPIDCRRLRYYLPELLELDDLFTISYYTGDRKQLTSNPDKDGWVCGSHIVVLHRAMIYDPMGTEPVPVHEHHLGDMFCKRLFRVVPAGHTRGL